MRASSIQAYPSDNCDDSPPWREPPHRWKRLGRAGALPLGRAASCAIMRNPLKLPPSTASVASAYSRKRSTSGKRLLSHRLQQWLVSSFTAWETAQLGDVRSQRLRHACHPPIGSGSPGEAALHKAQSGQLPLGNILLLMCSIIYPSKLHVVTCRRISAQHSMWHRDRKSLASADDPSK